MTRDPPFVVTELRENSNTAEDFLELVAELIVSGVLLPGDVLVLDNASIHFAMDIRPALEQVLRFGQVFLVFLPTYSPELNPCELVFGNTKYVFYRKRGTEAFQQEIAKALAEVTWENVFAFYDHCIYGVLFGTANSSLLFLFFPTSL